MLSTKTGKSVLRSSNIPQEAGYPPSTVSSCSASTTSSFCIGHFPLVITHTAHKELQRSQSRWKPFFSLTLCSVSTPPASIKEYSSIIATKYFHGNFMIDFLSAIPVQAMYSAITHASNRTEVCVQVVHFALLVLRLIPVTLFEKDQLPSRVVRVASHLGEWMQYSRSFHLLGIAQLMWLVLLFAHYMACIWRGVDSSDEVHSSVVKQESVRKQCMADFYYAMSFIQQGQGIVTGTWEENLYLSVAIPPQNGVCVRHSGEIALAGQTS